MRSSAKVQLPSLKPFPAPAQRLITDILSRRGTVLLFLVLFIIQNPPGSVQTSDSVRSKLRKSPQCRKFLSSAASSSKQRLWFCFSNTLRARTELSQQRQHKSCPRWVAAEPCVWHREQGTLLQGQPWAQTCLQGQPWAGLTALSLWWGLQGECVW